MGNALQRPAGVLNSDEYIILVGNIPWRGRWQDLKDLVREITSGVQRVEIYLTPDGRSRGFGYIVVKGRDEAVRVVERLDGFEWHGRALMAKLGNEVSSVSVLAPQPDQTSTSPSAGSPPPGPLPVPPLPVDYNSDANFPTYSNLAPSQLAAYNEWISVQAYYHYAALAHNLAIRIQEPHGTRRRPEVPEPDAGRKAPGAEQEEEEEPSAAPTRDREGLLEDYRRQANIAQRAAAFHSNRHHALLNEERARFQGSSPIGHQSSSSSSSSAYSMSLSRRETPNRSSSSTSPSKISPPPPQSFSIYHTANRYQGQVFPSSTMNNIPMDSLPMNYLPQRNQALPISPQGQGQLPFPAASMPPIFFGQSNPPLLPSFYPVQSTERYQYNQAPASHSAALASPHHSDFGYQPIQSYQNMPQQHLNQHAGFNNPPYQPLQPVAIPPAPMVFTNSAGVPVNLSHGAVQTENRGIFIGNLPYNTHWRDLRGFLSSAGTIIRCDVPRKQNNKGRGYATVLFASAEDADRACDIFNGTTFQGRQIRVRLDTYANTKAAETGRGAPAAAAVVAATAGGSCSAGSASAGGSGSGGNQSSFFTDGDVEREMPQSDQDCRRSSASV